MESFGRRLALLLVSCLLFAHHADARELMIAAAIGESYLPKPEPRSLRNDRPASLDPPGSNLPALGTTQDATSDAGGWNKFWIGTALVAAIAIIGNKGGGSVNVGGGSGAGGSSGGGGTDAGGSSSGDGNGGGILPIFPIGGDDNDNNDRRRRRDRH